MIIKPYSELSKWEKRFIDLAFFISSWSKDPSSKVGAVISKKKRVISHGFNGPPSDIPDIEGLDRSRRLKRSIHAEPNAIFFAKRKLKNAEIYVTHHPCSQCSAFIVQKKIKHVYCPIPSDDFMSRWGEDIKEANLIFDEAGVNVIWIDMTK